MTGHGYDPMHTSRTPHELLRLIQYYGHVARERGVQLKSEIATGAPEAARTPHAALAAEADRMWAALRLRSHPQAETIRQRTLADNARARREISSPSEEEEMEMQLSDTTEAEKKPEAAVTEKKPAKKTAKKPATPKKAAATKKPATPKRAAATAKKSSPMREAKIPLDAVIRVQVKENPRRKDTVQFKRFDMLMKYNGKKVEDYLKAKGDRTALNHAVGQGHVKI